MCLHFLLDDFKWLVMAFATHLRSLPFRIAELLPGALAFNIFNHNNSVHSTQQSTTTKQPKDVGSPADCLNMFQCYSIVPVPVSWWSTSNQEPVMAFGAPSRSSAGGLPTVQHSTAFAYHGVDVWCVIPLCLNRFVCHGVGKCSVEFCRLHNPLQTKRCAQNGPACQECTVQPRIKWESGYTQHHPERSYKMLRKGCTPLTQTAEANTHWAPRDVQWLSACHAT